MSSDSLRLIVADDEGLARKLARQYLEHVPDVAIVAECADTGELEVALSRQQADAALLDIRMPGRNVFDVLGDAAQRGPLPALIFATAYDRYAVRAFEVNAVDYLVKPFSEPRFAEALQRLRERRGARPADGVAGVIRDLGPRPDRLLVRDGNRMVPVAVGDITWIQAEADFARLHVLGHSYLVSRTLRELESRLDEAQFVRIHRSAIVRIDQIA